MKNKLILRLCDGVYYILYDGIYIVGSRRFIKQTVKAMRLLRKKAFSLYKNLVLKYLVQISLHDFTGVNKEGLFWVGPKTAFTYGLKWFASCLVHEAVHLQRYHQGWPFFGTDTQRTEAEKACNKVQAKAGMKIGLARHYIEFLKSADGTYWKLPRTW